MNIRAVKISIMSVLCTAIAVIFAVQAFAAASLSINIGGNISYTSRDIGAEISGMYKVTTISGGSTYSYLSSTNQNSVGAKYENYFRLLGTESEYGALTYTVPNFKFISLSDSIEFYVFIKNIGSRKILPVISTPATALNSSVEANYFNVSQTDVLEFVKSKKTAKEIIAYLDNLSTDNYQTFAENASIDNKNTYFAKIKLSPPNVGDVSATYSYSINIGFKADIQYDESGDILSVHQKINSVDPKWLKLGANANLNATAIKAETNSLDALKQAYTGKLQNAKLSKIKSDLTYDCDDYDNAVVYKDIDIVNVDVATGEIIGKLSDLNYPFEWYGNSVTLPAGTRLASGRVLTQDETFTVDVYTYYPEMYIRRWQVGEDMYISLSDKKFIGAVHIDPFYIATCTATLYNPDKTIAHNEYGIYPRSYVGGRTMMTGFGTYLEKYYGFDNLGYNVKASYNQKKMLEWSNNLTKAWKDYKANNVFDSHNYALGVSGEDWHHWIYQILYLVKYADNNSQKIVGYGNTFSASLYVDILPSGEKVIEVTRNGTTFTVGPYNISALDTNADVGGTEYAYYESAKSSGTIGLKGIANSTFEGAPFNEVGMAYGDDYGYYATDFLTYTNTNSRVLRDGYVGSDKYTAVSCLGKMGAWGGTRIMQFGLIAQWTGDNKVVVSDNGTVSWKLVEGNSLWLYVQFDEYDGTNYFLPDVSMVKADESYLLEIGYAKVSYQLPTKGGYYTCNGISQGTTLDDKKNELLSMVMARKNGNKNGNSTSGLTDAYWLNYDSTYPYAVYYGGGANETENGGINCSSTHINMYTSNVSVGMRCLLLI